MDINERHLIRRNLGLPSAVATMTGCVVGASIFIVPGELSSTNGPNAWLSYLIGAIIILFSCFLYAQTGAALPVSGANFRLCTGCINGTAGFLYVWCYFLGNSFLFPILSRTGAGYLSFFFPVLTGHELIVSILIVIVIGGINLLGGSVSGKIQVVCVLTLVTTVTIFCVRGLSVANWQNFTPLFPVGISPMISGVVSTYYAFAGVNCIIDMSGDIKDPGKNIPRTVFISMSIIAVMYIGMCVALIGIMPWDELDPAAPVISAASRVFPHWFAYLLALAALITCMAPLNSIYSSMSRVLYVMGKSEIFPKFFSKVNKNGVPYFAVLSVITVGCSLCLFYQSVMQFVNISSFYLLTVALLVGIASLNIRKKMNAIYEASPYKLRGIWYYIWPICTIIASLFFMSIELITDTTFALCAMALIPTGAFLYKLRERNLISMGECNLDEKILKDMEEEN